MENARHEWAGRTRQSFLPIHDWRFKNFLVNLAYKKIDYYKKMIYIYTIYTEMPGSQRFRRFLIRNLVSIKIKNIWERCCENIYMRI